MYNVYPALNCMSRSYSTCTVEMKERRVALYTYLVAAVAGAACEQMFGRFLMEKDELCGTMGRSASDTFHVT